ncbi:hypothetical protein H5410_013509 [Solanum commersonii]|uniref:Uncharacterized protein n=1 Tax=Solanum commersonii TaxID=4109 RepID=A0A9J5ZND2_SOLCO|nr:hypothetical protein H5410_013509 [Solanum commersonii]
MEPVGPHGQYGPFSRSNNPEADLIFAKNLHGRPLRLSLGASWPSWSKQPISKVKRASEKTLAMEPVGPHGQSRPFQGQMNLGAVKTFFMEPVGPHGQNSPFSRSNELRSCDGAPLLPFLYIFTNIAFNISALNLMKLSSTVISSLVVMSSVPLSIYLLSMPLPYLPQGSSLSPVFLLGSVVLLIGLILYNIPRTQKQDTEL